MTKEKKGIFSTELLKEIYLSKKCFLFVDEERVILSSPVATGIINSYDMNFWDQIKDHDEDASEVLSKLISYLERKNFLCNLIETQGIFIVTFSEKKPD
ncbi:MAG: hypothetical protein VYD54_03590 [Bdellovibrionota bacterium]|nr:hypothetical protein [Bdellovibrionota bacterium]